MSKIYSFLVFLGGALYFFFFFGFVFSTSRTPVVCGKYSLKHFLFLVVIAILFFPFIKILRWILKDSVTIFSNGSSLRMTPLRKFLYFGALFGVCLLPFEAYLRTTYRQNPYEFRIENFHPFLQVRPAKNDPFYHINSWNFRGDEITLEKSENTFRIFVMGGSTVFCGEVPFEKSHARILEKLLQAHYPNKKIEVMNAGYYWYTSAHSLIRYLLEIQDFNPDLIIMWHGVNDLVRSIPSEESLGKFERSYAHYPGPLWVMVRRFFELEPVVKIHLVTLDYFERPWAQLRRAFFADIRRKLQRGEPSDQLTEAMQFKSLYSFKRNIISLIKILKEDQVSLILCTQPYLRFTGESQGEEKFISVGMSLFNAKARSIADTYHVPFVDLDAKIPQKNEFFFEDRIHYTEKGNAFVAEKIASFIIQNGFINE